ncbi:MAG: hypothetical protein R3343_10010 [Nitriliruptorales bacterium]|nr:hypothetical protein [Nitriliruptorales bacterium]
MIARASGGRVGRLRLILLGPAVVLLAAACAGPEDPSAAANNAAPAPPATTTETEADESATTADGRLDFGAIAGTWRGEVTNKLAGRPGGGGAKDWIEVEIDEAAEAFSSVATMDVGVTSNEPACSATWTAIDATPPVYTARQKSDDENYCVQGRVRLIHDAEAGTLDFQVSGGNRKQSGVLTRIDS